jgi:hypothetical protein
MHYVFKQDLSTTTRYLYFKELPDEIDGSAWCTGRAFEKAPPASTLVTQGEPGRVLSDLLLVVDSLLVFSPRLRACLEAAGVTNVDYYPITLVDTRAGTTTTDYRLANVVGSLACLDEARSDVRKAARSGRIFGVDRFHLDEQRIVPLPRATGRPKIFRLDELKTLLLVDESIKAACEAAGITGTRFVPTPEYE